MNLSYWQWLVRGGGGKPGYRRFIDWWLPLHLSIGIGLAVLVPKSLEEAATSILFPMAGVLIGLTFAWSGNAQALLSSTEIRALSKNRAGGLAEYVYGFQSAILLILVTLITWSLVGLGVVDAHVTKQSHAVVYFYISASLFALISLTIRECWHVVLFSQWMLLVRQEMDIRARESANREPEELP
jgi:hypothetical protein